MALFSHLTEGKALQCPVGDEGSSRESALAQTDCAEGPPVAMEVSLSSTAEAELGGGQTSGSCEAAAEMLRKARELPRGVTATQQCAHCTAVLQHH